MKKIKNYNIFKESLIDKLTESNINLDDDDDGFDGYIIYTYGMDDESLLEIYKLLFLNSYKLPYTSRIEDLTEMNYNKTFLFLLKLEKKILSTTRYFRNNYTDICNFLANCGYDDKYYMFKDYNELKRVFKPLKLNDYFNNRKNIYESLLDKTEGLSDGVINNSGEIENEYNRLLNELDILKNKSKTFEEFETLVNYYGHRVIKDVDVSKLINTERVSGRPIKTTGPINVVEDIRNGKLYIIDGHNRTQEAKNNGQEKITAVVSRGIFTKKGNYFDPEIYILSDKYNINLKEFYNEKVTESVTDIFDNDDFDGYIIYTLGMEKNNILQIYKILFSNGYRYGDVNDTDLLDNSDFEKTFLLILKKRKVILVTSIHMNNDSVEIERFLSNNGLHEKYYLFKNLNDFKRIFNPLTLDRYFNNRKNIYESLLDKMEGPTKDEVWKNLGYEKSFESPEEFIYYIFDNLKRKMNKLEIRWVDKFDETVIKYNVLNKRKLELYVIEYLDLIYEIFNMGYNESKKIIVDILNKTFDIKEDINIFFIDNSDVY